MNNQVQPYAQPDAEFPAVRPAPPSGLTPADRERIERDFNRHPAFIRRWLVTSAVVIGGSAVVGVQIAATGFNVVAAGFAVFGVAVVYVARLLISNAASTPQHGNVTPDKWPATVSRETGVKQSNITIINNVTVNQ